MEAMKEKEEVKLKEGERSFESGKEEEQAGKKKKKIKQGRTSEGGRRKTE